MFFLGFLELVCVDLTRAVLGVSSLKHLVDVSPLLSLSLIRGDRLAWHGYRRPSNKIWVQHIQCEINFLWVSVSRKWYIVLSTEIPYILVTDSKFPLKYRNDYHRSLKILHQTLLLQFLHYVCVVEHPLCKRKVGISILPGGIFLSFNFSRINYQCLKVKIMLENLVKS